jgi:diguanylate cyclase (GGDEF)-like protein
VAVTPLLLVSIAILLTAAGWCIHLLFQLRDRQLALLGGVLGVVAIVGTIIVLAPGLSRGIELSLQAVDIATLGVSVLALVTVIVLSRTVSSSGGSGDAFYDPATGLPNRAHFLNLLERSTRRAERQHPPSLAVLIVGLDRFKLVNETLGHAAGDQMLVAVARRLLTCLRPGDVVARMGGDEFGILLHQIKDSSDATRVAKRVQAVLKTPYGLGGHELPTTASIGIVTDETSYDAGTLIHNAGTAMDRAKAHGKDRYELFDETMHARALALIRLETDLRLAIDHDQLRLYFQPVVSLESGRITGFEALVRWDHPVQGLLQPSHFIPLAEESGLIIPLGWWVLDEACRQMSKWLEQFTDMPELSVSVNLSPKQFQQSHLVERVKETVEQSGFDFRRLRFEITEGVLMEEVDISVGTIKQLRALGIQVNIDDFGTGYSSLSYLQQLPIDTLKIDRSFVTDLDVAGQKPQVIQAIVGLARDLGINVVAEGVETQEQSARLKFLKCDEGQGFLYSEPVDGDTATQLLRAQLDQ